MLDLFNVSPALFAGAFLGTLAGLMISIGAHKFMGLTSGLVGAAIIASCLLVGLFAAACL